MAFFDSLLTITIILLFFFLIYMGVRKQGIGDTLREIKEVFEDKVEFAKETPDKYA